MLLQQRGQGAVAQVHPGQPRPVAEQAQQGGDARALGGAAPAPQQPAAVAEDADERAGAARFDLARAEGLAVGVGEGVGQHAKARPLDGQAVGAEHRGQAVGELLGQHRGGGVGPQPDRAMAPGGQEARHRQPALPGAGAHRGRQVEPVGGLVGDVAADAPDQPALLGGVEQQAGVARRPRQEALGWAAGLRRTVHRGRQSAAVHNPIPREHARERA